MNKKFVIYTSVLVLIFLSILLVGYAVSLQTKKGVSTQIEKPEVIKEVTSTTTKENTLADEIVPPSPVELVSKTVIFNDKTEATFLLASEFDLAVAAEDLGKPRFIAMSPDDRLFVPDMVDWNLSREGKVIILDDFNDETHQFESESTYLSNLRGLHDIAFYKDKDDKGWIYIALTEHLLRYPYSAGDATPKDKPEIVTTFPNKQSINATGVVWHITRSITFHENTLYVSVGSGCNTCEEIEDELRAVVLAMDPDGKNSRVYVKGLRNAVGIEWGHGALYATNNGPDHLGENMLDDVMYKVEVGENYGWPYCNESNGVSVKDDSTVWEHKQISCEDVPLSFVAFEPHSAPLGVTYFENAHPSLDKTFLVAQRGSHQVWIGNGYNITRVSTDGEQEIFMDDFLKGNTRQARPVHVLQYDENSFFFTDDHKGRLYYVYAK